MISLSLGIPQIIYCIIFVIALGLHAIYHNQSKKITFNFWTALCTTAIEVALLVWGGFFG